LIRLRYTGLLVFATEVLSIFTGFIYLSLIARALSPADYGVWRFISGVLLYFDFLQSVLPFWVLRDCSRGLPVERTAILGSLMLSMPFMALFVLLAPGLAQIVDSQSCLFYLACIIIPGTYLMQVLDVIIRAKFPHKMAYKNVILDLLKIISIIYLIQFGLFGVILSFAIGLYGYIVFALHTTKNYLRNRFDKSRMRKWLSSSWLIMYGQAGDKTFIGIDVLLLGIFRSKHLGAYGVAETITSPITAARGLSYALYPKLLRKEQDSAGPEKTVMFLLMFLIPMTIGCVLLAPNLIDLFGSKYLDGLTALKILLIGECINVVSVVDRYVTLGAEEIDASRVSLSLSRWLKSSIFFIQSMGYVGLAIAVPVMVFLIPVSDITGAAVAIFLAQTVTSLLEMWKSRFTALKAISMKRLTKFLIASCVMSVFIITFYSRGTITTMFIIGSAIVVYFASLVLLDKETRDLGRVMINELKGILTRTI